jgi:cytochrome c oxidase subunit 4
MTHAAAAGSRIPEEPHGHTEPEPHHSVPYFKIFIALVVLTAITVLISYHRFSTEFINVALALLVACLKGGMVAAFFMHLRYEGKLIYLIFIVPLILCVLLVMALIPDIVETSPDNPSHSLHLFNPPPMTSGATALHHTTSNAEAAPSTPPTTAPAH